MLLKNRVTAITGAASARGSGKAMAQVFAEHGAKVAILDLDAGAAEGAARDIGPDHAGLACDVTDKAACERAAKAIVERFGQIDVLVNNAGITQPLKFMDIQPQRYEAVTDVSLRGSLYMSQAVVAHMRGRRSGSIVMLSSVSAQRGGASSAARTIPPPRPACWAWARRWRANWEPTTSGSTRSRQD